MATKEFREFFLRNAKVTTGSKADREVGFKIDDFVTYKDENNNLIRIKKGNRFLKDHVPSEEVFSKLFSSIAFKLNPEDSAKEDEQGLLAFATDTQIYNKIDTSEFPYAVKPSQLPVVVSGEDITIVKSLEDIPNNRKEIRYTVNLNLNYSIVDTINNLINYSGTKTIIKVTDAVRGGEFKYDENLTTFDNGMTFPATGKTSGGWLRQINKNDSINVLWYGLSNSVSTSNYTYRGNTYTYLTAQNHLKIQAAIDYAYANNYTVVSVPYEGTYYIDRPYFLKSNITLKGKGKGKTIQKNIVPFSPSRNSTDTGAYGAGYYLRAGGVYLGFFQQRDFAKGTHSRLEFEAKYTGYVCKKGEKSVILKNTSDLNYINVNDIVGIRSDSSNYIPNSGAFAGSDFLEFRKITEINTTTKEVSFDKPFFDDIVLYPSSLELDAVDGPNKTFLFVFGTLIEEPTEGAAAYGDTINVNCYIVENASIEGFTFSGFSKEELQTSTGGLAYFLARTAAYNCSIKDVHIENSNAGITLNASCFTSYLNITMDNIRERVLESAEGCHDNLFVISLAKRFGARTYNIKENKPLVVLRKRDYLKESYFISSDDNTYSNVKKSPTIYNKEIDTNTYSGKSGCIVINDSGCNVDSVIFEGYINSTVIQIKGEKSNITKSYFVSHLDRNDKNEVKSAIVITPFSKTDNMYATLLVGDPTIGKIYVNNSQCKNITVIKISKLNISGTDNYLILKTLKIDDSFELSNYRNVDEDGDGVIDYTEIDTTVTFTITNIVESTNFYTFTLTTTSSATFTISENSLLNCTIGFRNQPNYNKIINNYFDLKQDASNATSGLMRLNSYGNIISENQFILNGQSTLNNTILSNNKNNAIVNNLIFNGVLNISSTVRENNDIMNRYDIEETKAMEIQSRFKILFAQVLIASSIDNNYFLETSPNAIGTGNNNNLFGFNSLFSGEFLNTTGDNKIVAGYNNISVGDYSLNIGANCISGGIFSQLLDIDEVAVSINSLSNNNTIECSSAPDGLTADDILIAYTGARYIVCGIVVSVVSTTVTVGLTNFSKLGLAENQTLYYISDVKNNSNSIGQNIISRNIGQLSVGRFNDYKKTRSNTRFEVGIGPNEAGRKTAIRVNDSNIESLIPFKGKMPFITHTANSLAIIKSEAQLESEGNYDNSIIICTFNGNTGITFNETIDINTYFIIVNRLGSGALTITPAGTATILNASSITVGNWAYVLKTSNTQYVIFGDVTLNP